MNTLTFASERSSNHFGDCLIAKSSLEIGTIVQQFITRVNDRPFRGDLAAPLDERHVIVIGKDSLGNYQYGRVISDAKYVNHSCDPNCAVDDEGVLKTIKYVNASEELTMGYDVRWGVCDRWEPNWDFNCLCLAENCRKVINSYKK